MCPAQSQHLVVHAEFGDTVIFERLVDTLAMRSAIVLAWLVVIAWHLMELAIPYMIVGSITALPPDKNSIRHYGGLLLVSKCTGFAHEHLQYHEYL